MNENDDFSSLFGFLESMDPDIHLRAEEPLTEEQKRELKELASRSAPPEARQRAIFLARDNSAALDYLAALLLTR